MNPIFISLAYNGFTAPNYLTFIFILRPWKISTLGTCLNWKGIFVKGAAVWQAPQVTEAVFFPSGIQSFSVPRHGSSRLKWEKSLVGVETKAVAGENASRRGQDTSTQQQFSLLPCSSTHFTEAPELQSQPERLCLYKQNNPIFAAVWTMLLSHLQNTNPTRETHWLLHVHEEEGGWDALEMVMHLKVAVVESGKDSEKPLLIPLFRELKTSRHWSWVRGVTR